MKNLILKFLSSFFFLSIISYTNLYSENIKKIIISGNDRISSETIEIFSKAKINDFVDNEYINKIIKNLYNTNFFENLSIKFDQNVLQINVIEYPIIQNIYFEGIKSNRIEDLIKKNLKLKARSSYNEILLEKDKNKILDELKNLGYYFATVNVYLEKIAEKKVDIRYKIEIGEKSKIKNISFIGNKIFKDNKLRSIIISEEYKFWKFISGKKYLNTNLNILDNRLLKSFYLNNGYYNVEINSSYAKLIDDNSFELIFNINANDKVYFGDLSLNLPSDFDDNNFKDINILLDNLKGTLYSIDKIEKILDKIDEISILEQFENVKSTVSENLTENKINLVFSVLESEKIFIEKINVFGNNVTRESVIRNQFEIDEGDPYNEILANKTINNLKSLNFFKTVEKEIVSGSNDYSKIMNINIEEKPTGEIFAGAGVGTSGGTITAGVKENNYLGKGISLDTIVTINEESINGKVSIENPNYNNSDKSIFLSIESDETDRLKDFGYKSNKTGTTVGTNFEYLNDFFTGISISGYYENIETDSTASVRQQAQKGNYFDTFFEATFDYDKRNQKFQTTNGFKSVYNIQLPFISDTNSLSTSYNYKYFTELYDDNVSTFSYYIKATKSLTNEDIKLSERNFIPSSRLRGFESGKIGPKDSGDFIGGNFASSINITTTLPQILPNYQNTDFLLFLDAANVWGVDYNSALDSSKVRSSIGIAVDWFTPIGPLNFSLSQPITKSKSDITETFRFNLGTTF